MNQPLFLLLATLLCLATVVFISAPFWRQRAGMAAASGDVAVPEPRDMLIERREALLRELKDLEFDREMGKIDDEDYAQMRASTAAAASTVLQKLETLREPVSAPQSQKRKKSARASQAPQPRASRVEMEAEAEILIARARRLTVASPPVNGSMPDADGGWRCQSCQRQMTANDRFCASCGTPRP